MAAVANAACAAFVPLSREEAAKGREVCVTGVVTCVAHWQRNSFIVADPADPNGPALYATGEHPDARSAPIPEGGISIGDIIEVKGKWAAMLFASGIYATHYERLGKMPLPEPPLRHLHEFAQGRRDNQRTAISGVVQSVWAIDDGHAELSLATDEGKLNAIVPLPEARAEGLVDAGVTLSGVAMSRFNHRAEFLGVKLEVVGQDGVEVTRKAPDDPFEVREVPLNATLAWSPVGIDGHRVKVRGTVTLSCANGVFYIQSEEKALRVLSDNPPPSDLSVEVVGFPEMIEGVGQLVDAVWREGGDAPADIPMLNLDIAALTNFQYRSDVSYVEYDCRKASVTGRLCHVEPTDSASAVLFLEIGGKAVRVDVEDGLPDWISEEAEYEPLVKVEGIARFDMSGEAAQGRRPRPNALVMETKRDGLTLVPDAEWRRRHGLRAARIVLNSLAAIPLVLLVVGVVSWRRAVGRRRRKKLLDDERRRMADELHDTIEQHLAGARILLATAEERIGGGNESASKVLSMAGEVLGNAKREIRDVILNLRSEDMMTRPFADLIADVARELDERGVARTRCRLRGIPDGIGTGVKADLVAVVQQAVTNAISHGKAKNIVIVSDGVADAAKNAGGRFVLRVLNDGEPFDAAKALGPAAGHFGLANMRLRAKRSGFSIEWTREGKWNAVRMEVST